MPAKKTHWPTFKSQTEDDFLLCSATFLDYFCGSLKVIKMPLHELVEDSAEFHLSDSESVVKRWGETKAGDFG
jgi:hypothetical protein